MNLRRVEDIMGIAGKPSSFFCHLGRRLYKTEVPEAHVLDRPRGRADIARFLRLNKDKIYVLLPSVHAVVYQVLLFSLKCAMQDSNGQLFLTPLIG